MNFLPKNLFQKDYIGVSCTSTSLRALSINRSGQIKQSAQIANNPQFFSPSAINPSELSKLLTQLVSKDKFSTRFCAFTIPEYFSFSRQQTLPAMPLDEVSDALSWQIESVFPIPKEEIYYDWKLISQSDQELRLLINAVRKEHIDHIIQACDQANLKPISIEPTSSSLTRLISTPPQQPVILIEINPDSCTSSFILNRTSNLTITNQFTTQEQQDVKLALQSVTKSIQTLLNYTTKQIKAELPLEYLLTGESSSPELANWLTSALKQPVKPLEIPTVSSAFHQAYAAAKSTVIFPNHGISINLLPDKLQEIFESERRHNQLKSRAQLSLVLSFSSLSIVLLVFFILYLQLNSQKNLLTTLQQQNPQLNQELSKISQINKASALINSNFSKKIIPTDTLAAIEPLTPPEITINRFEFNLRARQLNLWGQSTNRLALFNFKDNLDKSDKFTVVSIPLSSLETSSNIDFSLNLILK